MDLHLSNLAIGIIAAAFVCWLLTRTYGVEVKGED